MKTPLLALTAALALATGCTGPTSQDRHVITFPPPTSFSPEVGTMLARHCGSLDCHGSTARAFRVYSVNGLRLKPTDWSGDPNSTTTDDEYAATYYSFVGIEPELTAQVIREGGARPERLTVIRKARGSEHHKGGTAIRRNGTADHCLTAWLSSDYATITDPNNSPCTADDPRIPAPDQF